MSKSFDCLQFCRNATAEEYANLLNGSNGAICPCLSCFGDKCSTCDIYKLSAKYQIDLKFLQRMRCSKCEYYNGQR